MRGTQVCFGTKGKSRQLQFTHCTLSFFNEIKRRMGEITQEKFNKYVSSTINISLPCSPYIFLISKKGGGWVLWIRDSKTLDIISKSSLQFPAQNCNSKASGNGAFQGPPLFRGTYTVSTFVILQRTLVLEILQRFHVENSTEYWSAESLGGSGFYELTLKMLILKIWSKRAL